MLFCVDVACEEANHRQRRLPFVTQYTTFASLCSPPFASLRYTNARGEGKFFSFDLLDAQGGEIRVVGWNDQVDRWFGKVEVGKVYMLSKASLRNKRGNFNQTRHQFEIHLENGTKIDEVADEPDIPQLHFNVRG